jgi:hypothetical protein
VYHTFVVRARLGIEIGVVGSDGDPFMRGATRQASGGASNEMYTHLSLRSAQRRISRRKT